MSREYKFRGKRADGTGWTYGFYWASQDPKSEATKYRAHFIYSSCNIEQGKEVIAESVGQFTGLHDADGKEIYEGDVVENIDGIRYVVEFGGSASAFFFKHITYRKNGPFSDNEWGICSEKLIGDFLLKIVGNIHDNPELIHTA